MWQAPVYSICDGGNSTHGVLVRVCHRVCNSCSQITGDPIKVCETGTRDGVDVCRPQQPLHRFCTASAQSANDPTHTVTTRPCRAPCELVEWFGQVLVANFIEGILNEQSLGQFIGL